VTRWLWVAAVVVAAVYSWGAAGIRPFTAPMDAAVGVPAALMAVLGWQLWSRRRRSAPGVAAPSRREGVPWAVLIGLLAVLEGVDYLSSPRAAHPTLSSIADGAMNTHAGRAVLIAAWLLLGWAMFLRQPAPSQ
jgi:hypothetical protein